jgi:hypothetical protein
MTTESFFNPNDPLWDVLLRFVYNLAVLFVIIRLIYNRYSDKKGYLFSFFLMGVVIFLVCAVLKGVDLHIGMAFGLFALFSIVRYRTKNIAIKEMSYFFTIMGVSAINALISFPHPVRGAFLINAIVILTIYLLEITFRKEDKKTTKKEKEPIADSIVPVLVLYNNLELLDPAKINELIQDVSAKTKITIERIQIRRIDLIQGNAELDVFYRPMKPNNAI